MTHCSCKISNEFKNFADVENYLNKLGMFHMELGLERMENAKFLLGLRFPCPIFHVVGTNGKGSTATFLHSIALSYGYRAGIFTSPHFVTPLERIKMNDRLLPKAAWASLIAEATGAVPDLTYFELLTVISVMAFMYSEPDVLVYEAGLGAKNDATTVIPASIVVFTPIALDHTDLLGGSIENIAEDKSYAIREGVKAVVSAPQDESVEKILKERAKALNIPYYTMSCVSELPACIKVFHKDGLQYELGLKGEHQYVNAQTALLAWHVFCDLYHKPLEVKALAEGLGSAFIAGRFQQVSAKNEMPALILDGAHNAHSLQSLVSALKTEEIVPSALVFSCLKDKNPVRLVEMIENYLHENHLTVPVYITEIQDNERAMKAEELEKLFSIPVTKFANLKELMQKLPDLVTNKENPCVIFGSLYLLSEFYALYPEKLQLSY